MKNLFSIALLALALPCFAQEMGLDLSDNAKPTPVPGSGDDLGLDLSEAKVPQELRPNIVLLASTAQDAEDVSAARAKLLADEILRMAKEADQFRLILTPADAKRELGNDYAAAEGCDSYDCFDKLAKRLKVQRVMLAYVKKAGAGSEVTLVGFDPALPEMLTATQDSGERAERLFAGIKGKSQDAKNKEFVRKMVAFLKTSLTKLSTANGKIAVDNVDPTALVSIDGVEVGTGTFESAVQRGKHTVKVTAAGFLPFEVDVNVEPLGTAPVKVSLRAREIERKVVIVEEKQGPAVFKKPGLYVAAGGVVTAGVGLLLGSMAAAVQKKISATAPGGVVPVTRTEVFQAKTNAMAANILVGVGGAAAVGGTVWVILSPSPSAPAAPAPAPTPAAPAAPSEGAGFGWTVTVGGRF